MEFRRINALPPYAFAQIDALKMQLRRAGEDVIDLAFGNPDMPSPPVAVEKLAEAVRNPRNHRYSTSRGIPKLRVAVADLYQRTFGVTLDFETEVCSTIGAKEGFSHLMLTLVGPGDTALVPSPSYPIHIWGPILAGAGVHYVRMGPGQDFFANLLAAYEQAWPRPRVIVTSFPHNPTTACVDLEFMDAARRRSRVSARSSSCTTSRTPISASTATSRRRSCRCRARRTSRSSCTRSRSRSRWRAGAWASSSATPRSSPRSAKLKSYLDYGIVPAHPDRGDRRDERGARLPEGSQRDLPRPARRVDRRARPHRLAHRAAQGDDVRLGADPRALRGDDEPRVRDDVSCRRPRSRSRPAPASAPAAKASSASPSSRTSSASSRPSATCARASPSSAEPRFRRHSATVSARVLSQEHAVGCRTSPR